MKDSKFWRIIAVLAVIGLFLNAIPNDSGQSYQVPNLIASQAFGDAPLITEFEEQQHKFIAVWSTDAFNYLEYRVLRWDKGALQSKAEPKLIQHVIFTPEGDTIVIVNRGKGTGVKVKDRRQNKSVTVR